MDKSWVGVGGVAIYGLILLSAAYYTTRPHIPLFKIGDCFRDSDESVANREEWHPQVWTSKVFKVGKHAYLIKTTGSDNPRIAIDSGSNIILSDENSVKTECPAILNN